MTAKLVLLAVALSATAHAQSATTGTARGVVRDTATGNPAVAATLIASSPALIGEQVAVTDDAGQYFFGALPPGVYRIAIYYRGRMFVRGDVVLQVGKQAIVDLAIDMSGNGDPACDFIQCRSTPPMIDHGSAKLGITVTGDFTRNLPLGRTFGDLVAVVPGAHADTYGISIAGATSPENVFIVDGLDTTDTAFGGLAMTLPQEFLAETELVSGGFPAELGRATGGIIHVVTKSGSNEFHGSVFGYVRPGALASAARIIPHQSGSIDGKSDLDVAADVGAELGGPIIKDKLWFHVGFDPSWRRSTVTRVVARQVDRDGDGVPDVDRAGLVIHDELARSEIPDASTTYFFTGKLSGAIGDDHRWQLSTFGNPTAGRLVGELDRSPAYTRFRRDEGAYDLAGTWTSRLGATELDAVAGFHRGYHRSRSLDGAHDVPSVRYAFERSLHDFVTLEGDAIAACADGAGDDFPLIRNCPITNYGSQGLGFLEDRTNDRISTLASITHRVQRAGYHTLKAGLDLELSTFAAATAFSGNALLVRQPDGPLGEPGSWDVQRVMHVVRELAANEMPVLDASRDQILCEGGQAICDPSPTRVETNSVGRAAFVQDSWQLRPNLTLALGLRWEALAAYAPESRRGKLTPGGEVVPDVAYSLTNMLAPRLGVLFDPTYEGKSKLFAHWGRFYENVPLFAAGSGFGGALEDFTTLDAHRRLPGSPGYDPSCDVSFDPAIRNLYDTLRRCPDRVSIGQIGEDITHVAPNLEGQYTQELIVGAEYELVADLRVSIDYVHRSLPQVIEDVSADNGSTFMLANPGRDYSAAAAAFHADAAKLAMAGDPRAFAVERTARELDHVGKLDKPVRDYDAIHLVVQQRPTKRSVLHASYTYSVLRGNYDGLFDADTGQLAPNLTSMFDLVAGNANRYGALTLDRPHDLQLAAFYVFDLARSSSLTTGAMLRVQSGAPHDAFATLRTYNTSEVLLVPRGSLARSPVSSQLDLHLAYTRKLTATTALEGFVRVADLFDGQDELHVDQIYTRDFALPVVGGDRADLAHVKALDTTGRPLERTVTPNPSFERVDVRRSPRTIQLGARFTF